MKSIPMRSQGHSPNFALTAKRPGAVETWFGANGELNAGSRAEVVANLQRLTAAVASGEVQMEAPKSGTDREALATIKKKKQDHLVHAFHDHSGTSWKETGSAIGAEVSETSDREGFMRRLMVRGDAPMNAPPRVRVKVKNVTAVVASSVTMNEPQYARDKYIWPPEFYITGNTRVEEREIVQGSGEILDDAYFNTVEQITVEEDKVWKRLADGTIGIANNLQVLAGGLTPSSLTAMRTGVTQWGIPAMNIIQATDLWNDIIGNASVWGTLFDPVTQFEMIQTGYLGTLLGMGIITDAFRMPTLKVLSAGEIYVVGAAEYHGTYTDRGPVQAVPVDSYQDGVPARGWFFSELVSITIHNARSVVKGIRA